MSVVKLSEIKNADTKLYGGKAASLSKMIEAGFSVPDGFVVDADSYQLMDDTLEKKVLEAFDRLGSEYVAVRSSATVEDGASAAWAGQLDTFLNTTKSQLIKNIEACWTSLQSDRARAYADENSVDLAKQKVAVVVQEMVQSEVAGVAFSVHPVTQNRDQIVVEAAYGLGEAVVSGQVTPDTYIVEKQPLAISARHVATQTRQLSKKEGVTDWQDVVAGEEQKLSDEKLLELCETVSRIEDYYSHPVDVEWLEFEGRIYITQSRPITTLKGE